MLTGMISDIILLYSPTGGYEDPNYEFLKYISNQRLLLGSAFGMISIPFVAFGIAQVNLLVNNHVYKRYINLIGYSFIVIGVLTHLLFGLMGFYLKLSGDMTFNYLYVIKTLLGIFSTLTVLLHLIVNVLLIKYFFKEESPFPRWFIWINPLTIYLLCVGSYIIFPSFGRFAFPAGFNLSYFLFFSTFTFLFYKKTQQIR